MTTTSHTPVKFIKSPLGRLIIGLTAIFIFLFCSVPEYVWADKPLSQDNSSQLRQQNARDRVNSDVRLAQLGRLMPIKTIRLLITDQYDCLQTHQIKSADIRAKLSKSLGVTILDTAGDAPLVTLTVSERSAAPFSFRTLIMTKVTMAAPQSGKTKDGALVYSEERSDIYSGKGGLPLQAAIDKAITRLQLTFALVNSDQRPPVQTYATPANTPRSAVIKMYEPPQKQINGQRSKQSSAPN